MSRVPQEHVFINGKQLELDREYTIAVRDYIFGGFDGYDELPNCTNIDSTTDIDNMFNICLKFFELVNEFNNNNNISFNENLFKTLKQGVFGFDLTNTRLKSFMNENTVVENGIVKVVIKSQPRIQLMYK